MRPASALCRSLSLVVLAACGGDLTQETFPTEVAPVICQQTRTCALGYYESEYRDEDDCISQVEEQYSAEGTENDAAGCVFDLEEAEACVEALKGATCEEWFEGDALEDCADVWTCASEV